MNEVQVDRLAAGYKLVAKPLPYSHSVSIGIFTKASLNYELAPFNGISHFLEHMLFRGTGKRSAQKINQEVDAIGAKINAYTARDYTCFHIKMLPEVLAKGLDILTDLFFNASLKQADCLLEQQIITEEINMVEDTPDDYVFDLMYETAWAKDPLGKAILGTKDSILNINESSLHSYYQHYFDPKNTIIAVVGNFQYESLKRLLNKKVPIPQFSTVAHPEIKKPIFKAQVKALNKKTEQAHIALAVPGFSSEDPEKYTMSFLATVLGGSMSSRLFQEIREKRAWAYSVFAHHAALNQSGLTFFYAGVKPENMSKTIKVMLKEFKKLQEKPLSQSEFNRVRSQLKGQLLLGLERPSSWLYLIGKKALFDNDIPNIETMVADIMNVKADHLQRLAQNYLNPNKMSAAIITPKSQVQSKNEIPFVEYIQSL